MKFQFSPTEIDYVASKLASLVQVASRPEETAIWKLAKKLSGKFTPNAGYVWLNGKEREFLASLIVYRLEHISGLELIGDEYPTVRAIAQKLRGEAHGE